jgi:hypothetical protein
VIHRTTQDFWACYGSLPTQTRTTADKAFALLKLDPRHPSLRFKKIGRYWSVRAGLKYRAVGVALPDGVLWFWIGSHVDYDRLLS